jgi:gliding motility-associated-like protein
MKIIYFVIFFYVSNLTGQIVYFQDNYHGGVTGAGFSTLMTGGSDTLKVHIAPGSTIRKAYLFGTEYWNNSITPISFHVILGNQTYTFNSNSRKSVFHSPQFTTPDIYIHSLDITSNISPTDSVFPITVENNPIQNCDGCVFSTIYLYVLYENPNLGTVTSYIVLNNQDEQFTSDFELSNLNSISQNSSLGWAINASRCGWFVGDDDGSYLRFNNHEVGLLKGNEELNLDGPQGCFYFENSNLFGLSNDTPDSIVNHSDALLDASTYYNGLGTLNWTLEWEQNTSLSHFNIYNEFFIEHGTTCESNVVNVSQDTTICANTPLLLEASGGITYEWSPSIHLSCTTCANPIFLSDSSELLTLRIWSSDSCSVVRPVKISVLENPKITDIQTAGSICGINSGEAIVSVYSTSLPLQYEIDNDNFQLNSHIQDISAGNHLIRIKDQNECISDTMITIDEINNTEALFNIPSNLIPVGSTIYLQNNSTYSDQFIWTLVGINDSISTNNIEFPNPGLYEIKLIAFQYDEKCADTLSLFVEVFSEIHCIIPNVITPNNDGVNDIFSIDINSNAFCELYILNRNGNSLFKFNGNLNIGLNLIWDGKSEGKYVDDGTYFYIIKLKTNNKNDNSNNPILEKSQTGFFQVIH